MRDIDLMSHRIVRNLIGPDVPGPANSAPNDPEPSVVDHATRPILLERIAHLRQLARFGEGSASEILKQYTRHNIQLSVRLRSGDAELHESFADIFFVLDGYATLVSGGIIRAPQTVAPGEIRGAAVEGGHRRELRSGDIAHIPAGTSHQILLAGDTTFAAIVVKIREIGEDPQP